MSARWPVWIITVLGVLPIADGEAHSVAPGGVLVSDASVAAVGDEAGNVSDKVPGNVLSKRVCVNAEVDGQRALSYDCLSQQLAPTMPVGGNSATNAAEGLASAPSNQVGTFNYSAESIRFGSNWGKSAEPQRPAPVPAVPLR